jgi:hydroxypyruvate reductase
VSASGPQIQILHRLFQAAVASADPLHCLPPHLPPPPRGRTIVVGAGKAAAAMAQAVERHWPGPVRGMVVTRYGHGAPCRSIEVIEASHPVPDAAGEAAAQAMLDRVKGLTADDLVLCLISGGGSALLALPVEGVTLAHKRTLTQALLKSGAAIHEINAVRKHLSRIKGGRLAAAAYPAQVETLAISDVPGDDPATIASGPTVADPTTFADAREVLARHGIEPPPEVRAALAGRAEETPKPGDPRLARAKTTVIATARGALAAAAAAAAAAGYRPVILGDDLEGEAREVGAAHAHLARAYAAKGLALAILSGGETTVTVKGRGRGGRNAEYLLSLALALNAEPGVFALAADTDGIDGSEDNAGAVIAPDTIARAQAAGIDLDASLRGNDAYGAFHALGDLIVTGPTRTNVNDFRAILVDARGGG